MTNYTRKDLLAIIQKYLAGKSTLKEREFLELYYGFFEKEEDLLDKLSEEEQQSLQDAMEENILKSINQKNSYKSFIIKKEFYKLLAAASVFFVLGVGVYLYYDTIKGLDRNEKVAVLKNLEVPVDKTILTLTDGTKLVLDDADNGQLADELGVIINKLADGSITYTVRDQKDKDQKVSYNTVATPNGKLYQINLPDGTRVWLNAESSLKFPTSFNGKTRTVELNGEAYFEVAKNKRQPFVVNARRTNVTVLGTHFNISAYSNDEVVKTTLTEGSVLVNREDFHRILRPGQQSIIKDASDRIEVIDIDVEEAMAWKNGYFIFNNEDITTVMKTISRWYDIDVVYEGDIKNEVFIGTISRFDSIEKLLKTIELTGGVKFKIESKPGKEERKVTVMP